MSTSVGYPPPPSDLKLPRATARALSGEPGASGARRSARGSVPAGSDSMDRRRSPWRSAAAWLLLAGLFGGAPQAQAVEVTVLSATLTVEAGGNVGTSYEGYCLDAGGTGTGTPCLGFAGTSVAAHGGLSDTTFELDGTTYTIKSLRWGSGTFKEVGLTLDQDLADDITLTDLTLEMETPGGTTYTFEFSDATLDVFYPHQDIDHQYYWGAVPQGLLNLTDTAMVSVKIIYDSDEVADDVTLSALSLVEGSNTITLDPTFASATTDYTASVANGVETVTVTATKNTSAATVTISPTDAGSATGHQVGLAVGTNTITATVTHGSTTGAYTVVVTRAVPPATGTILVNNFGLGTQDDHGRSEMLSQHFTAGSNLDGYTLDTVEINWQDAEGDTFSVKVCTVNMSNEPTSTCTDFTSPAAYVIGALPFAAPSGGMSLDTATNYAVVLTPEAGQTTRYGVTNANNENNRIDNGWSIGDEYRRLSNANNWLADDENQALNLRLRGSANTSDNEAPEFSAETATRSFDETEGDATVQTAADLGAALTATDGDNDTLTYTLEGTDAAKFEIVSTSGQIQTKVGVGYSHEAQASYSVTVKADDDNGGTDTIAVTINVNDVNEPPIKPNRPTLDVRSSTLIQAEWSQPDNTGRPALTRVNLRYRKNGISDTWTDFDFGISAGAYDVSGLDVAVAYEFQVRFANDEGNGPWSNSRVGSTASKARPVAPAAPTVAATSGSSTSLDVSWTAPATPSGEVARPAITDYDLRYCAGAAADCTSNSDFTEHDFTGTGTSTAIPGLTAGTTYQVQVRGRNTNGTGGWSDSGSGSTSESTDDTTAPTVSSATVNDRELVITFDEDLAAADNLAYSAFTVKKTPSGGSEETLGFSATPSLLPSISGATLTLWLHPEDRVVPSDTGVKVSYTKPTSGSDNKLQDAAGNEVADFTDQAVTNSTTNHPATGEPGITGPPQVGETLTATLGDIMDADGVSGTFPDDYSFQWIREDSDGGNQVNIGTDDEYTVMPADLGKRIDVLVSFFDDGNTFEGRASDLYPAAGYPSAVIAPAKTACPDGNEWCTEVTAGFRPGMSSIYGFDANTSPILGDIDDAVLAPFDTNNDVITIGIRDTSGADDVAIVTHSDVPLNSAFNLGGTTFTVDASARNGVGDYEWSVPAGFSMVEGQKMTVSANFPPTLDTATVDGDSLVLTYHEALDTNSTPAANAYSVKVDSGAGAAPSDVTVSGKTVTLTLGTAVTAGQAVTVDYTVPNSNPVQDASGLKALPYSNYIVTNDTGTTPTGTACPSPTPSDQVWCTTLTAESDGKIFVGFAVDTSRGGFDLGSLGDTAFTVATVSYTIEKLAVSSYGNVILETIPDLPEDGAGLTLHIEKKDSGEIDLVLVDRLNLGDMHQGWDFSDAADYGSGVLLHAGSSEPDLADATSDGALVRVRLSVSSSDTTAPTVSSATVNGTELVLTFDEDLAAAASLANSAFTVKKTPSGGSEQTLVLDAFEPPSISGATVTLTLLGALAENAVVSSDTGVKVSYVKPTSGSDNKLQDAAGNEVAGFTDQAVTNNTPNSPPTGNPGITGTPQVGETLTATLGDLADADGLPDTFPDDYNFTWQRTNSDGTNPVTLGTDDEYTLMPSDLVKRIRVRVVYTDDGGRQTTRDSHLYPARGYPSAVIAPAKTTCPNGNEWCTDLTVGFASSSGIDLYGFSENTGIGGIDDLTFYSGEDDADVEAVLIRDTSSFDEVVISTSAAMPLNSVFNLGGTVFTIDVSSVESPGTYEWSVPAGFSMAEGQKMTVSANFPPSLDTAAVDGASLVLTYHEALDTNSTPAVNAYSVEVDSGTGAAPSDVTVSGTTVTLTLGTAVTAGQTVKVSYTVPNSNPVQDASGLKALPYSNYRVTNDTSTSTTGTACPSPVPDDQILCTTLTVGNDGDVFLGYSTAAAVPSVAFGNLGDTTFVHDSTTYSIRAVAIASKVGDVLFETTPGLSAHGAGLTLHIEKTMGELALALSDNDLTSVSGGALLGRAFTFWDVAGPDSGVLLHSAATGFDDSTADGTPIRIRLTAISSDLSGDFTLSGLAVTEGGNTLALSPAFDSGTTSYSAGSVAHDVDQVTLEATANHAAATIAYQDGAGNALTDADGMETGFQADLAVGANTIQVAVTAEDGSLWVYAVRVGRAVAAATGTILVDNFAFSDENASHARAGALSQHFVTGQNTTGYTLETVELYHQDAAGGTFSAKVCLADSDDNPTSTCIDLVAPAAFVDDFAVPFTASGGMQLDADTTYAVVLTPQAGATVHYGVALTKDESNRIHSGWSIGDAFRGQSGSSWNIDSEGDPLVLRLRGDANPDAIAPTVSSARVNGTDLILTFDETLAEAANLSRNAFSMKKTPSGGSEQAVSLSPAIPEIKGSEVILGLAAAVVASDTDVKVSYTKPTSGSNNKLRDTAGNEVASFTDQAVTNNSPAEPNNPAGGTVTINGGAQEGITLSVDTSGITDDDGLNNVSYSYQWLQVDGSTTTEIGSATDSTYTVENDDVGKTLRVKVDFEDDATNPETLTSAATASVIGKTELEFSLGTARAGEGSALTVSLVMSPSPTTAFTVGLTSTYLGGATSADFTGLRDSLAISRGQRNISFNVGMFNDTEDDDDESVRLGLSMLPAWVEVGSTSEMTLIIDDNDHPEVTVEFDASTYAATEGSTVVVTVELSAAPERLVTIPIMATNQGGATAVDYSGVPSSLTLEGPETSLAFTVTVADDTDDDDGESVKLEFGTTLPTRITTGTTGSATINLTDNDGTEVAVSFGASSYTATEGGTGAAVAVSLASALTVQVVVPIEATDQGGASSGDYSTVPSNLTFAAGDTSKTFTVTATDDAVDDDDESVKLSFDTLPMELTAGGFAETTIALADDDVPDVTVSFGAESYMVAEGGSVAVTVALSEAPERSVTIPIAATNQDGASDADYSGVPASVVFAATEASRSFTITATDDAEDDDGESVKLSFGPGSLPSQVTSASPDETTVSLADGDHPMLTASISAAAERIVEGETTEVTISLSAPPERTVTLVMNRGGTATVGAAGDYQFDHQLVTFGATETSKVLTLEANDDAVVDVGEVAVLSFSSQRPEGITVVSGAGAATTVTIVDDDFSYMAAYTESDRVYEVDEAAGTLVVTVRSRTPTGILEVDLDLLNTSVELRLSTADDTAEAGSDYTALSNVRLVFAPADYADMTEGLGACDCAEATKTATVSITPDTVSEGTESFELALTHDRSLYLVAYDPASGGAEAVVNIADDDDAPALMFSAAATAVDEDHGAVVLTASISGTEFAEDQTGTVVFSGTATRSATGDYTASATSLTLAKETANASATLTVTIVDDTADENPEEETIIATLAVGTMTAAVTITVTDDDDPEVTVSFGAAEHEVAEGAETVVAVNLSTDPERAVTIGISATGQDGATPPDYDGLPHVTFTSGQTSSNFTFRAKQDNVDDDGEKVQLGFEALPDRVTAASPSTATVTLVDDDERGLLLDPTGVVGLTEADADVSETYTLVLTSEPTEAVTVTLSVTGDDPLTTVPTVSPGSLTFTPSDWAMKQTVTVTAPPDADGEDERATVTHAVSSGGDYGPSESETLRVGVTDDETRSGIVALSTDSPTLAEAAGATAVTVTATLNAGAFKEATTVTVELSAGANTEAEDFAAPPPASLTLTIPAQATEGTATFTITPADDALWEPEPEQLRLRLAMTTAPTSLAPREAVIVLEDDDLEPRLAFTASATEMAEAGGSVDLVAAITSGTGFETERTVALDFSTSNATHGTDYLRSRTLSNLVLPAGAGASATVTLTAVDDAFDEDDGTAGLDDEDERIRVRATHHHPNGDLANRLNTLLEVAILDDDHPGVFVSFAAAAYTAVEGASAAVVVEISTTSGDNPERDIVIPIPQTLLGGASAADYSGVPATVTILAGDGDPLPRFTVTVTDDAIDDDGEGVQLGFDLPIAGDAEVELGLTPTTTVSFTDNDERGLFFSPPSLRLNEGGREAYQVRLTSEPTAPVTLSLQDDGLDLTDGPSGPALSSLTFTASNWSQAQTVSVLATLDGDSVTEARTIRHQASGGDYGSVSETYTVTVVDLTTPATSVSLEASHTKTRIVNGVTEVFSDNRVAEDEGTATVRVTARLDGAALATATTVTVTLSPGTASASDYTANPSTFTLVIAALGFSANRDVSLTPEDDGEEEGDETIVMSATVSGSLTVSSTGEFVIEDNDMRGVTVTPAELNLAEGESGTYTVSLASTPTGSVTVAVSSDTPSVTASPAELVFTTTDTGPKTVTATAEQDADASNERATVSHAVSGADYGSVEADPVRVNVDDDEVGSSGIELSLDRATVSEGAGATAVEVTAALDGGSLLQDVTVSVSLAPGTAMASDYGLDRNRLSIVIAAGQASGTATVTLTPVDDGVDEDEEETITVTGTASNGLPVTGVTLAITDDDTRGVTVTPTSLALDEGGLPGTYAVSLDSAPTGSVTVMATVAGDAEASVRVSPTTLVFTATNYGAQTVTVRARGDRDQLGGTVTVSHAVSGADYGAQTADDVTVTVTDTGIVQWDVELSVDDVSALPEGGGAHTVNVMAALLTGVQTAAVAVQVEVTPGGNRPASANDFRASPSRFTLTIPAGQEEASRPLTLTPTDDGVDEGDETLVIAPSVADHLTTNEGGVELTITDDDTRGVTVAPTTLALDEGARGTYTVSLGSQPESSVTVSVTVSGSDSVTASPSSLVFTGSNWRQARAVTVQAQPDPGPNDENATLSHAVTGGDYEREGVAAAAVTVTVTDDDKPSEAVRLTVSPTTVSEGAGATPLTVTGTLDAAARTDEMTVSVTIPAGAGYTAVDAELTIAAGATSGRASLTLTPVNDAVDADDDISVTVNATTAAQATLTDGSTQAMRLENADGSAPLALTVTITDDDTRSVIVRPTSLTAMEGGDPSTYTVRLGSEPSGGTVSVSVSLADDDPNAGTGATAAPSSLAFTDADWNVVQTVTVTVANDDAVEADATATVTHAVSGADYGLHNVTAAAVTITVPGYELTADGGVQLRVPPSGMVTVPSGTPVPAGLNVSVPTGHRGKTVTVRTTTAPGDDPPGFRLLGDSGTIVDIDGVTLGSGETATVCLPTTSEEGDLSVQRWDETAMEWVNLDAPSGGSPSGQVCGETDHFSIFAVMVRLEEPRLVLSADTLTVEIGEEDGAAYTVALTIAPAGSVTVSVSASAPAAVKLAVAPDTLVFTDSDYGVKTVTVAALEDAEAGEAVLVHEASGGRYLAPWHAELTVTVEEDTGLLTRAQKAWLARFGRTLATHVMEAVGERISAGPAVETKLSLGGSQPGTALLSGALKALAGQGRPDGRRMLAESSFVLPLSGGGGDGSVTAWGRGAYTEFDGEESGLAIDGEVASGLFGVDWDQGRWRLGLLLSHSEGDGEIRERDGEAVDLESTLTGVHPYARYETEGGLMAWGVLGYGEGELERKKDGESSEVDIDLRMAAFGVEGELGEIEIGSGVYGLKLKSDVMAVRMEADGDEQLPGVEADASRVRLLVEGSGHCPLESGGVLRPALEAGLRFDEGDAETGLGVELGATLRYADATGRLSADLGARALVAHEENDYDEWGVSGALVLEPDRAGRGLSLSLGSSYGATQSGTDELWSRKELSGISETQGAAPGSRFEARLGYGLNAAEGRGVLTPYAGYERQGAESTWRLGSQLALPNELEFRIEGHLRHGGEEPQHGLAFTVSGRW